MRVELDEHICDVHTRTEIVLSFREHTVLGEMCHQHVTTSSAGLVTVESDDECVTALREEATDFCRRHDSYAWYGIGFHTESSGCEQVLEPLHDIDPLTRWQCR